MGWYIYLLSRYLLPTVLFTFTHGASKNSHSTYDNNADYAKSSNNAPELKIVLENTMEV